MSHSNPVSKRDQAKFVLHMAKFDQTDPWELLDQAEEFMLARRYKYGDPDAAVKQYHKLKTALL